MPKLKKTTKIDGRTKTTKVATKMRIGSRKSGRNGYEMSNDELNAVLADKYKSKYHAKARTILASRT